MKHRQQKWMVHTLRHDNMPRDMIEGRVDGKRLRGGQRRKMLNAIMDKDTYQMTKNKAQNRDEWR